MTRLYFLLRAYDPRTLARHMRLAAATYDKSVFDMDGLIKFPVNLMSMSHKRLSFNITTTSASYS